MPHPHPSPVAALWPFPERGEQDQPHRLEQLLAPGVRSVAACAVDRGWAGPVAPEALRLQLSPEGRASERGGIGPGSGRLACRGAGGRRGEAVPPGAEPCPALRSNPLDRKSVV